MDAQHGSNPTCFRDAPRFWRESAARPLSHALAPLLLLGALVLGGALGAVLVAAALPLTIAGALGRPILSTYSSRDSLTGLGDHRSLTAALDRMLLRRHRGTQGAAAMVIEINCFKRVD